MATQLKKRNDLPIGEEAERRVRREIRASVHFYAKRLELIEERLDDLEKEWDVERTLEAHAGLLSLIGFVFGIFRKRWRLLPVAAACILLENAFGRWCLPMPVYRRLGLRTSEEVTSERLALKALRGDFGVIAQDIKDADERAEKALLAAGVEDDA